MENYSKELITLLDSGKVLLSEISSSIKKESCISVDMWNRYAVSYLIWLNTDWSSDMDRAMFKPNKPGYEFANNY